MAPNTRSAPPPVQTALLSSTPLSALKIGAANGLGASKSANGLAVNKPFLVAASRSALVSFSVPNDPESRLWKSLAGEILKVPLTSHPPTNHLKHALSANRVPARDPASALIGASSKYRVPVQLMHDLMDMEPIALPISSLAARGFHSKQVLGANEGFVSAGKFDRGVSNDLMLPLIREDLASVRPMVNFDAEISEEVKENELYFAEMGLIGRFQGFRPSLADLNKWITEC
ncbi:hypothetical protein SUGI_0980380 [Cryptomeria japonica]|nr:hypothetical protein SUGI_0980380 [Cryptomeria japonica]